MGHPERAEGKGIGKRGRRKWDVEEGTGARGRGGRRSKGGDRKRRREAGGPPARGGGGGGGGGEGGGVEKRRAERGRGHRACSTRLGDLDCAGGAAPHPAGVGELEALVLRLPKNVAVLRHLHLELLPLAAPKAGGSCHPLSKQQRTALPFFLSWTPPHT